MGVYIPPPSDGNNDNNKGSGRGSNNDDQGTTGSKSSTDKLKDYMRKQLKFGVNPSLGLRMWGPLVPPPDNKLALTTATGLQFIFALTLLYKSKNLRNKRLIASGIPPTRDLKFKKWTYIILGTNFLYDSFTESVRLGVPIDPWAEERAYYKNQAVKAGKPIHWWFGPQNYTPMTVDQYFDQFDIIINPRNTVEDTKDLSRINDTVEGQIAHRTRLNNPSKFLNHEKFSQLYDNIYEKNHVMHTSMLKTLEDTTELNKGQRLDDYLEDKAKFKLRKSHRKPPIILGTQKLDTDDDLDYVWDHFEPWVELAVETDYDIRLVPKSHNFESLEDH